MKLDKKTQLSIAYAILTLLLLLAMQSYFQGQVESLTYSDFRTWVAEGRIAECNIGSDTITGRYYVDGGELSFSVTRVEDAGLVDLLEEHEVKYSGKVESTWFTMLLSWILPALIFVGIWMVMARRMGGGSWQTR